MLTNLLVLSALAQGVLGHMEMSWPYPFKSKFNPANDKSGDAVDWSMTAPLGTYPCKGYIDSSAPSVATWSAGSTVNYTIAGTAIHGGGSCQISMSYDQGKTWNVIYSHIGGCLIEGLTENVVIPKDAPSGDALFAWSWFNLLGNREMYQNCAPVTITNGGSGLDTLTYPAPFIANVDAAPGCKTIENTEVVFPDPGPNVKYGGKYAGTTPKAGLGVAGTCAVSSTGPSEPVTTASTSSIIPIPASSSVSARHNIPSGNGDHAAAPPSSSVSPFSTSVPSLPVISATPTNAPKKCKRRNTIRGVERRHERMAGRTLHERLVRRRKSRH